MPTTIQQIKKIIFSMETIDVAGNLNHVPLTLDQVFANFKRQYRNASVMHWQNLKCLSTEEQLQLTPPQKCKWYLCHQNYGESLENFPGYELHMVDENSSSGVNNSQTDMVWSGSSWEV